MRRFFLALLLALLVLPVWQVTAQDTNGTLLERLAEEQLSGPGRIVQIDGFRGALSSSARMDRLTVADDTGPWLIIEDVDLDWQRTALLRGEVLVRQLSAGQIRVLRKPIPADTGLPAPEARSFSLPKLPVSIQIDSLSADRLDLAADILAPGQTALTASLSASARLSGGAGQIALEMTRSDGPGGYLGVDLSLDPASGVLDLAVTLTEDAGGVATTVLGIPGAPSLDLSVTGAGPARDFQGDLRLATSGEPRLTGRFQTALAAQSTDIAFDLDLSGDLSPLVDPDLRVFFGADSRFQAAGLREATGKTRIDSLALQTAALQLDGDATLAAGGKPERLFLRGRVQGPSGGAIRLPVPGPELWIDTATATLDFDATASDRLVGQIEVTNLRRETLDIARLAAGLDGTLQTRADDPWAFDGALRLAAEGTRLDDPRWSPLVGQTTTLSSQIAWGAGADLRLRALSLTSDGATVAGDLSVAGLDDGLAVTLDLTTTIDRLARFASLADRPLTGALQGQLRGTFSPLAGSFDIMLDGQGTDLGIGNAMLDPLLSGQTDLALSVARTTEGLVLREFAARSASAKLGAQGLWSSAATDLSATLSLSSLARLVPGLDGPATASATITAAALSDPLRINATARGPAGSQVDLSGTIARSFQTVDLTSRVVLPLALANPFLGARRAAGVAEGDLRLQSTPTLSNLSGQIALRDLQFTDPALPFALTGGTGRATLGGGSVALDILANATDGGTIQATGSIGLRAPRPIDLRLALRGLNARQEPLYQTRVDGDLRIDGALSQSLSVGGTIALGVTELRLGSLNAARDGLADDVRHIGAPATVQRSVARAFPSQSGSGRAATAVPILLDIQVDAPSRVFVRGRGLDAELGGRVRLQGPIGDITTLGEFGLIRGRFDLLGKRLSLDEGRAVLRGSLDPEITVLASAEAADTTIFVALEGQASAPRLTIRSDPFLPQEEALALFLFGRGLQQLSVLQAAQLASALITLSGDGSGGILDRLRAETGLDDLDISSDPEGGGTAVRAGKYLSDNVYSDLSVTSEGRSSIRLNLDLTPSVTLRGETASDGRTGLGIFFERDY